MATNEDETSFDKRQHVYVAKASTAGQKALGVRDWAMGRTVLLMLIVAVCLITAPVPAAAVGVVALMLLTMKVR